MHSAIPLTSPLWQTMVDNYGPGTSVPMILRRLLDGEDSEFGELYGRVCHQGTPSQAAYAAFPYLLEPAKRSAEGTFWLALFVSRMGTKIEHPEGRVDAAFLTAAVEAVAYLTGQVLSGQASEVNASLIFAALFVDAGESDPLVHGISELASGGVLMLDCECSNDVEVELADLASDGANAPSDHPVAILARQTSYTLLAQALSGALNLQCDGCMRPFFPEHLGDMSAS